MTKIGRIEVLGGWHALTGSSEKTTIRLLCFPHAGGGAGTYNQWITALRPEIQVCSVRLPGRENLLNEQPFTSARALIDELLELLPPTLHSPYALFGHSMGAHLAFELAREIERLHLPAPRVLIVSGRTAPHLPQNAEPIHQLSDADFIARLQERYQGIPQSLLRNSEALRLFIPAMRADMTLIETCSHQPGNPLDIPLIALGGEADPFAGPAEMQAWHTHTRAAFKSHFWSGGHFYLHEQADLFVPFLGATLRAIG